MLAAVLLVNEAGSYMARPLVELSKEKVTEAVEIFLRERTKEAERPVIASKIGSFFYQEIDDLYVVVLADGEDEKISEALKIAEVVSKSVISGVSLESKTELFTLLSILDELFVEEGVINRTVEDLMKVVSLQSNDEVLHQMIQKNREKEKAKADKVRKMHPAIEELTKEIEEIKILRQDLKTPRTESEAKAKVRQEVKKSRTIIESLENCVNLVCHQKQTATVNSATEAAKIEGMGEFLIRVTDEECGSVRIDLKKRPVQARGHPSIDKKAFSKNVIQPKTDLPLNTPLILMKWTLEDPVLPVEVSFWQTEVSEERYKFFVEVTALGTDVKYVNVRIPIKRVSDIEIERGRISGDHIVADMKDLKKDDSQAVEFSGLCDDTDSLFPFVVYYTVEEKESLSPIEISGVYASEELLESSMVSLARVIEGECTVTNN
ncbi:uncharacterized protein NEMAJ01_1666 [Nematocida major]|uniref:uncharacterized protein n=1 Tax=Nematocida major TaxID=1912982 RepID=UPI002008BB9F|nr:uncharacterized protein NEMAJ01_1666 [Nematocida major]KAH9386770.1 hypothetical protein NEMAJ01_1666 [Nematocida major]